MPRSIFAGGSVDLNWDEGQIKILLAGPAGETSEEIRRRARAVQRRAQAKAPVRTGTLRSSISVNTRYPSEGAVADITAEAPYSMMVEFGRRRVYPVNRRVLVWQDLGGTVFALTAGPVRPTHFMQSALDAAE